MPFSAHACELSFACACVRAAGARASKRAGGPMRKRTGGSARAHERVQGHTVCACVRVHMRMRVRSHMCA
eukprot:14496211-Alexandrium_andersonii.AAC.1